MVAVGGQSCVSYIHAIQPRYITSLVCKIWAWNLPCESISWNEYSSGFLYCYWLERRRSESNWVLAIKISNCLMLLTWYNALVKPRQAYMDPIRPAKSGKWCECHSRKFETVRKFVNTNTTKHIKYMFISADSRIFFWNSWMCGYLAVKKGISA